jgi:magnesium-transporting ATPase (P-type)
VTNGIQDVALAFGPNEGDVLQRKPRSPRERIFNQLMIERTVVAALIMGVIGFLRFGGFCQTMRAKPKSPRHAMHCCY